MTTRFVSFPVALTSLDFEGWNREVRNVDDLLPSLRAVGLLHPVLVREGDEGRYVLIAGHRRVAAARVLQWESIAATLIPNGALELVRAAENVARDDLTPAELCEVMARLLDAQTADEVAAAVGRSVPHVRNLARVKRSLAPDVWEVFAFEGKKASLPRWLQIAALPHEEQRRRLLEQQEDAQAKAASRTENAKKDYKSRPVASLVERLKGLDPGDMRARMIGWMLGKNEWPESA